MRIIILYNTYAYNGPLLVLYTHSSNNDQHIICNRRFLHRRVPASIPTHTVTKDQLPLPKRSSRSSDLRSFFGLDNQLTASTDQIAKLLKPMGPLLSLKNEFLHTTQYYSNLVALNTVPPFMGNGIGNTPNQH